MKIKLKELLECYEGIQGVFDSITKFARVVELSDNFDEAKRTVTLYEERRKAITPAGDGEGKVTPLELYEFRKQEAGMLEEEIELKQPVKFTVKECEVALEAKRIVGSQYNAMRKYFVAKEK